MRDGYSTGYGLMKYLFVLIGLIVVFVTLGGIGLDIAAGHESSGFGGYVRDMLSGWLWDVGNSVDTGTGGFGEAIEGKKLIDAELDKSMDVLNGL